MSSWINFLQSSNEYEKGVEEYLDKSFSTQAIGDQINCPCKVCYHRFWHRREMVFNHLITNGIEPGAEGLRCYEKGMSSVSNTEEYDEGMDDDIEGLIYDVHRNVAERYEGVGDEPNDVAKKFYKLVEDGKQELYPGCKKISKLSFLIRLYFLKCTHGLTNKAFSDHLELFREVLPEESKVPKSFNEAKKLIKDLGLHYDKIDACRNDCMLYWKEHEAATFCHVCHAPRWKETETENQEDISNQPPKKVPAKVLWHFPLKPRLQRLYMCSETAELMRWHDEERDRDELLRHPADGEAWKEFDQKYPDFAKEARNVRLGRKKKGKKKGKSYTLDSNTLAVAHRYVLFNCEDGQVESYMCDVVTAMNN